MQSATPARPMPTAQPLPPDALPIPDGRPTSAESLKYPHAPIQTGLPHPAALCPGYVRDLASAGESHLTARRTGSPYDVRRTEQRIADLKRHIAAAGAAYVRNRAWPRQLSKAERADLARGMSDEAIKAALRMVGSGVGEPGGKEANGAAEAWRWG